MKLACCIAVIMMCAYSGLCFAKREKMGLCICEELFNFVKKLERGIGLRLPMGEIITEYVVAYSPEYIKGGSVPEMCDCLESLRKDGFCDSEIALLKELLLSVGKSPDGTEQQKRCSEALERLKPMLDKRRSDCAQKRALYVKLGVVVGILACITVI